MGESRADMYAINNIILFHILLQLYKYLDSFDWLPLAQGTGS